MNYQFEWDWVKNTKNWWKHGINFSDASQLWYRYDSIFRGAKKVDGEQRLKLIGKHENEIWSVIYTLRGKKFRIISAHRASKTDRADFSASNYSGRARP